MREFDLTKFIISKLRSAFLRWPPRSEALRKAKQEYWIEGKSGMLRRVHFKCAVCGRMFNSKDVAVDHIKPVGKTSTWDQYIDALFCTVENLQILCSYAKKDMAEHGNVVSCHSAKSAKEAAERKEERARTGKQVL